MAETRDELIQKGRAELRGTWPEGCLQRAFVDGASWWEFHKTGASMWQSDRHLAEAEAVKMYGVPANPPSRWHVTLEQETDGRWIGEVEAVPGALAYGETTEEAAINAAKIAQAAGEPTPNDYLLELIDILARPIQDGGEGMADNQDSPLMRLREKILAERER